jgi:hypothetical protein
MTQRTDLYSILISYAKKHNSPYIDIEPFLGFLKKYAIKQAEESPEWYKWTKDTDMKFYSELSDLAEEDKCELLHDTPEGRIYMSRLYPELLQPYYKNMDENSYNPFPDAESLGIVIPESQSISIGVETGLTAYLENPAGLAAAKSAGAESSGGEDTHTPAVPPILHISFPDNFGSALVLSELVPRQLTEACLLKIRHYLKTHNNRDYIYHKMYPQMAGKESLLRDMLNQLISRPLESYIALEEAADFSFMFWAHFCIFLKEDIKKKKDRYSDDIAAIQAGYILEGINSYFRTLAVKKREKEAAFRELEANLKKPPLMFTVDQIIKSTNSKGILLLDKYSRDDLEMWLKRQTTEAEANEMPSLLFFRTEEEGRWFVHKSKLLALCARLLAEAREKIKAAIVKRWIEYLKEYHVEPAQEKDKEFDKLLEQQTRKLCPILTALLDDPKLQLVYDEMERSRADIPLAAKIFDKGLLLPYSSLLLLRRKDLLNEAQYLLPFWFSSPFLYSLAVFFKNLFHSRPAKGKTTQAVHEEDTQEREGNERSSSARDIALTLIPPGYNMDTYLKELESRWLKLIDKQARANLLEDMNALVRDNLRGVLRVQRNYKITREGLTLLASDIISRTPSLRNFSSKDALRVYMEIYLVKLLQSGKF